MIRKTAIVTGGFGDIGKAVAEKFAKNHYNIALTYHNNFDPDFVAKLKGYGVEVLALRCDQTSESSIINFVSSVYSEFEYVDACVLAAGKAEPEGFLKDKPAELIDEMISTNLRGNILFVREVLKKFQAQKHGNIAMISSIYAKTGGSLEAVYSAAKAGLVGLVKSVAIEAAPYVRINAVAPGFIKTNMTAHISDADKEYVKSQTPLARLGEPEDVANVAYFLCSDESSFVTGETITVSGGATKL